MEGKEEVCKRAEKMHVAVANAGSFTGRLSPPRLWGGSSPKSTSYVDGRILSNACLEDICKVIHGEVHPDRICSKKGDLIENLRAVEVQTRTTRNFHILRSDRSFSSGRLTRHVRCHNGAHCMIVLRM